MDETLAQPNRKRNARRIDTRTIAKSLYVTLSGAKGLCAEGGILRFAQNDRHNSDFAIVLGLTRECLKYTVCRRINFATVRNQRNL